MRNLIRSAVALTASCGLGVTGLMAPSHAATGEPLPSSLAGTLVGWGNSSAATTGAPAGANVVDVDSSQYGWSAAVLSDGSVVDWGDTSVLGDLPDATGFSNVDAIDVGDGGFVVRKKDGTVAGADAFGLGFEDAPSITGVTSIAAGFTAAAAVAQGKVYEWGPGASGPSGFPAPDALKNVTGIAGTSAQFTAVESDGTVVNWGASSNGTPATAADPVVVTPVPESVQGLATSIAGGQVALSNGTDTVFAAVRKDGSVQAWDKDGEIATPPELAGKQVVDVDVNGSIVALTADGEIFSWGTDTTTTPGEFPAPTSGVPVAVAAGGSADHVSTFAYAIVSPFKAVTAPKIAGAAVVGSTLTATAAIFDATPDSTPTGQWLADGNAIAGATGTTYTLTAAEVGKTITYRSTATHGSDTVDSDSAATSPVEVFKAVTGPKIAGAAVVGHALTATPATFNATPESVAGQWLAGGTAIPGATGRTLTLTSAYLGKHISYRTTAVFGGQTVASDSAATSAVVTAGPTDQELKLEHDQAKLKHDQAKLKHIKKAYKKAHGHKKAKLKKKIAKLKKTIHTDKKHIAADK